MAMPIKAALKTVVIEADMLLMITERTSGGILLRTLLLKIPLKSSFARNAELPGAFRNAFSSFSEKTDDWILPNIVMPTVIPKERKKAFVLFAVPLYL